MLQNLQQVYVPLYTVMTNTNGFLAVSYTHLDVYKRQNPSSFIMDSEHNILITLPSDNLLERLIDLLQKHGETDNDGVIGISMLVVAAIYEKYKNGELYRVSSIMPI